MGLYPIHGNWREMNEHINNIKSLINLSIEEGPFFTGGGMLWMLENKYHSMPNWVPDDLDICCISEEQFTIVKNILEPLATHVKITNWLNHSGRYWTINNFKIQAFVHPVPVQTRLDIVDITVTAIASDGVNFSTGKNTLHDIEHKLLKYNDGMYNWPRPTQSMDERYYKYLSRGYNDLNNETLTKLKHLHEIWATV
jgi:hypothetical protein